LGRSKIFHGFFYLSRCSPSGPFIAASTRRTLHLGKGMDIEDQGRSKTRSLAVRLLLASDKLLILSGIPKRLSLFSQLLVLLIPNTELLL
jgi:hypothetical protein